MALTALTRLTSDSQHNGGVKTLYFANRADVTSMTPTSQTYSAVTMSGGTFWYTIQCQQDSVIAKASGKATTLKGPSKYDLSIEGYLPLTIAQRDWLEEVRKLGLGVVVAIEFYSGQKYIFGYDEKMGTAAAMTFSECEFDGGKDTGEAQGMTFKLASMQVETPHAYSFTPATS